MSVYVDRLVDYGWKLGPSCHLTADSLQELHAFALSIGCSRWWCSDKRQPLSKPVHYDLTHGKRVLALAAGAVDVSGKEHEHVARLRREQQP